MSSLPAKLRFAAFPALAEEWPAPEEIYAEGSTAAAKLDEGAAANPLSAAASAGIPKIAQLNTVASVASAGEAARLEAGPSLRRAVTKG